MGDRIVLELPARPVYLATIRTVVTSIARSGSRLPDSRIDDLRLTVTEACANAMDAEHRAHAGDQRMIVLRCHVDVDQVVVEVHDEAGGFDPAELAPHPPVTRPDRLQYERGLGIPLMRALADEVEFRAEGGGTTVQLVLGARARRGTARRRTRHQ